MSLPKKVKLISLITVLAVAAGGLYLATRHESDASQQSTDNAYVQADFTLVAPQVAGQLSHILVKDNQAVKAGQLLALIDDRDLQVAKASAEANVAAARASISSLEAQIKQQSSRIQQSSAAVKADRAALKLAQANLQRYSNLSTDGAGSVQEAQQAASQQQIQQAAVERDLAAEQTARDQVAVLQADLARAQASLAQAQAAYEGAQLKLSYTKILAPVSGTIARRSARPGAYVNVGQALLAVVPLQSVYIEANYRETQLAHIRPGHAVEIKVDSLPGVTLQGKVASVSPASNMSFAPIAPQNATGNFTKVVQRLPVRIELNPQQPALAQLRVGMSVQPTVLTR